MNMEILEGNKLIAKFMGYSKIEDTSNLTCDTKELWIENKNAEPNKRILQGLPNYHSSWDWLMPVVKKIFDYLQNIERPSVNHCCKGDLLEVDITCWIREINIEKTHAAIAEFIKWYNLNQPTH